MTVDEARKRIIVALDVPTLEEALKFVRLLADHVGMFKVGLELINAEGGPQIVRAIHTLGGQVFYDIKLHDIPNTMKSAARTIASQGVLSFNVHASAGVNGMKAAVDGAHEVDQSVRVWAVSVLTSHSDSECTKIFGSPPTEKVVQFARDMLEAGVHGCICSPQELSLLSGRKFMPLTKATPGVRPEWAPANDQQRVMTPGDAIRLGADYLVIGRPMTNPPASVGTPVDAARLIAEEIASAG